MIKISRANKPHIEDIKKHEIHRTNMLRLKQDDFLAEKRADELAEAIAVVIQKAGLFIGENIYEQLPEKYKKYFEYY